MSFIVEYLCGISAGLATTVAYSLIKSKFFPKKSIIIDDNSIPWSYDQSEKRYFCVKCRSFQKDIQYEYCECCDHCDPHFHFKCIDCKFVGIMRTADKK